MSRVEMTLKLLIQNFNNFKRKSDVTCSSISHTFSKTSNFADSQVDFNIWAKNKRKERFYQLPYNNF